MFSYGISAARRARAVRYIKVLLDMKDTFRVPGQKGSAAPLQETEPRQALLDQLLPLVGGEANVVSTTRRGSRISMTKALRTLRR